MQPAPPVNYGVILFSGFQALDVFGTLDVLNILSTSRHLNLYILAASLDPISTKHNMSGCPSSDFGESVVPTHTFTDPPVDLEVLLIPGGRGTRDEEAMKPVVDFVRDTYSKLSYLLTVCTGSAVLARTGILDRRRATSNKKSWAWVSGLLSSCIIFQSC
jgi:putative intracellular protease/amidase